MAPATELLLYGAARAELVRDVVEPALAAGKVVLLDRYEDSTYAYQGAGRGIPEDDVRRVSELATGGLRPDLTILIDIAWDVGHRRLEADPARPRRDRMESEDAGFHERVRRAYRARAAAEPGRFLVIDGLSTAPMIQSEVRRRVLALLQPDVAERST